MANNAVVEGYEHEEGEEDDPVPKSITSASQTSLASQPSVTSQVSEYNFTKILRWLQFVDDNLESSSNQLLYLGAYHELKNRDSEGIVRASDVYHLLKEKRSNDTEVLARFMYGLKKLGRKRRGLYCNNQFSHILKMAPPDTKQYDLDAMQQQKFGFYQCLVDICVNLEEDRNISKRVRMYACRHVLGVNPDNERTVAKVFLKMLKKPEVLSDENQDQLALVLGQIGAPSCLVILQHFRSQFNLHEIDWEHVKPYLKMENISPAPSTSTLSSNGLRNPRLSPLSHVSTVPSSHPSSARSLTSHRTTGSRGSSPQIVPDPQLQHTPPQDVTEQTRLLGQGPLRPDQPPQPPEKGSSWKCKVVTAIVGLSLFLALGLGLSMIVLAAIETSGIDKLTLVYQNTTVALGNVQMFTTEQVTLYQDPGNDEVSIPLKFYRSKEPCQSLHSRAGKSDTFHNDTLSLHQSQVVVFRGYLLDGSEFNYSFCAVTNQLNATNYHVDFYIVDGLDENLSFDPDNSHFVYHQDIGLVYSRNLQQPNNTCLQPITHTLTKSGYYSVVLFRPSQTEVPVSNLSVWYSRNDQLKVIDTSRLQSTCSDSSASRSDPCEISIGSREHLISVFCIVVEVGTSDYDPYTHIQTTLTDWDAGQIWFYVLGGFVITLCVSFFVLTLLVCFCKCRKV